MNKQPIQTNKAPEAIGTYSQAVKKGPWVFVSGQIPKPSPTSGMIESDATQQIQECLEHLQAVIEASGLQLSDVLKLTVYVTDLGLFQMLNEAMAQRFTKPYPARAVVEVKGLPRGALIELDAICMQ